MPNSLDHTWIKILNENQHNNNFVSEQVWVLWKAQNLILGIKIDTNFRPQPQCAQQYN